MYSAQNIADKNTPHACPGCGVPLTTDDKLRYMYRRFGMLVSAPPGTRSSHPQIAMCMPMPGHALVPPARRVLPKWRLVLQSRFLHCPPAPATPVRTLIGFLPPVYSGADGADACQPHLARSVSRETLSSRAQRD